MSSADVPEGTTLVADDDVAGVGDDHGRQISELRYLALTEVCDDLELLVQSSSDVLGGPVTAPFVTVDVCYEQQADEVAQPEAVLSHLEPRSDDGAVERSCHPLPIGNVWLRLVVLVDVPGDDEGGELIPELGQSLLLLLD